MDKGLERSGIDQDSLIRTAPLQGDLAALWLWVMEECGPELWRVCGRGAGLGGLSLFWLADPLGNPGSFQALSLVAGGGVQWGGT